MSLSGELTSHLHIVAGALLMSPEVIAAAAQQPVGIRPVGQPGRMEQLNLSYSLPWLPKLSIDGTFTEMGSRVATVDNTAEVPMNWNTQTDGGLTPIGARRAWAYFTVEM